MDAMLPAPNNDLLPCTIGIYNDNADDDDDDDDDNDDDVEDNATANENDSPRIDDGVVMVIRTNSKTKVYAIDILMLVLPSMMFYYYNNNNNNNIMMMI
jgi:hypothetical protein